MVVTVFLNRIECLEEGVYLIDGRVPVSEAGITLGVQLPSLEAHTIGGMIISHLRHIPAVGESVVEWGYQFTVTEVTNRGALKLRVERVI